jgi:hypothetical protein
MPQMNSFCHHHFFFVSRLLAKKNVKNKGMDAAPLEEDDELIA